MDSPNTPLTRISQYNFDLQDNLADDLEKRNSFQKKDVLIQHDVNPKMNETFEFSFQEDFDDEKNSETSKGGYFFHCLFKKVSEKCVKCRRMELQILTKKDSKFKSFPVSNFGISLGLAAQANMWRFLDKHKWTSETLSPILTKFSLMAFFTSIICWSFCLVVYLIKLLKYWPAVLAELRSNARNSFFFAPLLTLITLTLAAPSFLTSQVTLVVMFGITFFLQFLGAWVIVSQWLFGDMFGIGGTLRDVHSTYLMTTVGFLLSSILASRSNLHELALFSFSIGIVLYLMILFFNFHYMSLKDRYNMTIFLNLAPPSVSSYALAEITKGFGPLSHILIYFTVFVFVLLSPRAFLLICRDGLTVSMWAMTFPITNMTVGIIFLCSDKGLNSFPLQILAFVFCGFTAALVTSLSFMLVFKPELCYEDHLVEKYIETLKNSLNSQKNKTKDIETDVQVTDVQVMDVQVMDVDAVKENI